MNNPLESIKQNNFISTYMYNSLIISLSFPLPKALIAVTVKMNKFGDANSMTKSVLLVSCICTVPFTPGLVDGGGGYKEVEG